MKYQDSNRQPDHSTLTLYHNMLISNLTATILSFLKCLFLNRMIDFIRP